MIPDREALELRILSGAMDGIMADPWELREYTWTSAAAGNVWRAATSLLSKKKKWTRDDLAEEGARLKLSLLDLKQLEPIIPTTDPSGDCSRLRALGRRDYVRSALAEAHKAVGIGDYESARAALLLLETEDDVVEPRDAAAVASAAIEAMSNPFMGAKLPAGALADALGDLPPGAAITIGGYTGTAKSSLALYLAVSCGEPVAILSSEDPERVWGQRLLAHVSGVPAEAMQRRTVTKDQRDRLVASVDRIRAMPVSWYCRAGIWAAHGISALDRLATGKRLVIVDYLQAFRTHGDSRCDAVSDLFKAFKSVGDRRGCAVLMLSQLSRPKEGNEHKEPGKLQLKESGDIENESEAILMLWNASGDPGAPTLARLAKLKWGPSGAKFVLHRDGGIITGCHEISTKGQGQ